VLTVKRHFRSLSSSAFLFSPAYSLDKGLLTDSEDLFLVSLISTHSDGGSGGGGSSLVG